jgi:pyruvate dehydrogenase E1 component alpha subunit
VDRARSSAGPTLLEAVTYRWRGHYEGDPQPYRTSEEVAQWRERDPIKRLGERLGGLGILSDEDADAMREEILASVEKAVAFAQSSPMPEPAAALADVYTDILEEGW